MDKEAPDAPDAPERAVVELDPNFQVTFEPLSSQAATLQIDIPGDASGKAMYEDQAQVIGSLSLENERLKQRYGKEAKEALCQIEEAVGIGGQPEGSKEEMERIKSIREYWSNMKIEHPSFDAKSLEMQQMI